MAQTIREIEAPGAPPREPPSTRSTSARTVLGWAGVVAAVGAAATLAVVTLTGDSDSRPTNHSLIVEHGSIRAIEGSVEDTVRSPDRSDPSAFVGTHPLVVEYGSISAIEGSVEDSSAVVGAHPLVVEYGSIRAIEGSVEDSSPDAGAHPGGET
jgi:hypothetical protein